MQLGLPWWIGSGDPQLGVKLAAEAGYDLLEVSMDAPWPGELEPTQLADRADDTGIELGFHAPWRTQALAHPREELAQAAREVAQRCVTAARAAGASYVVFHVDARDFGRFPREDVVGQGLETAHASLRALSRSAGDELSLLVENTSPPVGTPEGVARFIDPLPEVEFCLDPGHAAIVAHETDASEGWDPRRWREALGDRWSLLHLMDLVETGEGVRDHLLPGAGQADLERVLDEARNAGCERVLVEAFYTDLEGTEPELSDWRRARELVSSL